MSFIIIGSIVVLFLLIFLLYKLWKSINESDEEYTKVINELKKKIENDSNPRTNIYDNYIIIEGYVPSTINTEGTFVWDHVDQCATKDLDNFIWTNHVFGSYVNSFNSDEDFTLIRMPKCTTYIKKKGFEKPEEYDDKACEVFGFTKTDKRFSGFDNMGLDDDKKEEITEPSQSEN